MENISFSLYIYLKKEESKLTLKMKYIKKKYYSYIL